MNKTIALISVALYCSAVYTQGLKKYADSLRVAKQIPELAFAVISADSILELQVLGFHRADIQNEQTKATRADYFHLGSNTKAITGFIAAYLVENKQIEWTTKFFDLFPEWKKKCNPAYYDITLANLLSHRARIQPYTNGLAYDELPDFKGNRQEQRKLFAQYILNEKPVKDTVNNYHYSNAGYSIAALMLEKVSGKTWEQLTVEILMTKLNIKVKFGWPNKINLNQPYGHWVENDTLREVPPDIKYSLAMGEPAGDISMTLPDYATFIQSNLQGLNGMDNVLKAKTYNYLHFGLADYSIGWANFTVNTDQLSEHSGSAGTFFCYTLMDKSKNLAYIIIVNSATEGAQQGVFQLLEKLRKEYGK